MDSIESRFSKHEAVCAERWKTTFKKLEEFEKRSTERYEEHKREFSIYRRFVLTGMGIIIMFLLSLLASGGMP